MVARLRSTTGHNRERMQLKEVQSGSHKVQSGKRDLTPKSPAAGDEWMSGGLQDGKSRTVGRQAGSGKPAQGRGSQQPGLGWRQKPGP